MRKFCLLLLLALVLSACGQKGPLYLPDQEQPKKDRVRP
ncbi:MAG TPA: lipoprotein [Burkholderiales bacterium]|jgi:predicted small lipoprotein YifL|nr:lipoprotein [Burkholderiales bacterium]